MTQKPRREFPSLLIALALGLVSVTLQVIAFRELLGLSRGNEHVFAMALGVWLLLVALGSGLGDILSRRLHWFERRGRAAIFLLVVASCLLPIFVVGSRFLRPLLGLGLGELLGPANLLALSGLYLAIPCLVLGMTFPLAATLYRERGGGTLAYLWEGLGATLGGIGLVISFQTGIDPVSIACTVGAIGCVMASPLSQMLGSVFAARAATAPALLLVLLSITGLANLADDLSRQYGQFPDYALLVNRYTPYGNLAGVSRLGARYLYENGSLIAGNQSPESTEPLPNIALASVSHPQKVLLIGGGPSGMVAQALAHNPDQLDYVELDPDLSDLARSFMTVLPDDRRLNTIIADPRRFLTRNSDSTYDAIILASGEPVSLLAGRLCTVEALKTAADCLSPQGILALQVHGAENYLPPKAAAYIASIMLGLRQAFPKVEVIPGQPAILLAYKNPAHPNLDANEAFRTITTRGIYPQYLTRELLWDRLEPMREERFNRAIVAAESTTTPHSDLTPVAFRADWLRYSEMMDDPLHPPEKIGLPVWMLLTIPILPALGLVTFGRLRPKRLARGEAMSWLVGFSSISGTVIIFYIFQIAVGSLYLNLALLTAISMLGLALGSFLGRRSRGARAGLISSVLLCLPLLILPSVLPQLREMAPAVASTLIMLIALMAGGGTGAGFAAACGTAHGRRAGFIYAVDVIGAAAAAIWGALVLLPEGGLGFVSQSGLIAVIVLLILSIWEWITQQIAGKKHLAGSIAQSE